MTLRVNHNIAAINSHRNLLLNDHNMSKTLEKLSSGMKINRAADGPATLVISEQMRAQIAGLTQAIDNSETAVSMIQTTEANLAEVNSLLTNIRQLAIHAANEGVNDELMLKADQDEIINSLNTIDRIANQAQFGNKKLLDGSNGASGITTGKSLDFVNAGLRTRDSATNGFAVRITQVATKASLQGEMVLTQDIINKGETLTVIENGKKATYTTNKDDNIDTAIQNLKSEIHKNGLQVDLYKTKDGKIKIEHSEFGTGHGFQALSSTAGILSRGAGEIEVAESGVNIKGTINGESAIGKGQVLTGLKGTDNVDGLSIRYTGEIDLNKQAKTTNSDSTGTSATGASATGANATGANTTGASATGTSATGANTTGASATGTSATGANTTGASATGTSATGANTTGASATGTSATGANTTGASATERESVTRGSSAGEVPEGQLVGNVYVSQNSLNFQVGANRGQTVGISVGSVNTETLSRGLQNESNFFSLHDIDVRTFAGSQDALLLIDHAINQITSKRGELGAFQKNNLESNLHNLRTANENLISSESVIRDTDMASEMSAFTRNQIMTQSAIAMLAQANQTPKAVLKLLG